jgi:hypothetical protein
MAEHWLAWPAAVVSLAAAVLAGARARRTRGSERSVAVLLVLAAAALGGFLVLVAVAGTVL